MLLKLKTIEVLISEELIDSNIKHDEFVLKEHDNMAEEIKNSNKKICFTKSDKCYIFSISKFNH